MKSLVKVLGVLHDAVMGPCNTTLSDSHPVNAVQRFSPDALANKSEVFVESRRLVYKTVYRRPWIPNKLSIIFLVTGYAPDHYRDKLPPEFFETVSYPNLASYLLRWSDYPHVFAVDAFVSRFLHGDVVSFTA
jgi:hypothetical protein